MIKSYLFMKPRLCSIVIDFQSHIHIIILKHLFEKIVLSPYYIVQPIVHSLIIHNLIILLFHSINFLINLIKKFHPLNIV